MGVMHGINNIVTDNLVLCLDAANRASYPGSGTSWKDVSGNGNTGTISGATYTSDNGGTFNFDGVENEVSIPDSDSFTFGTGDFTIDFWVYFTDLDPSSNGTQDILSVKSGTGKGPFLFTLSGQEKLRVSCASGSGSWNIINGAWFINSFGTAANTWYNIGFTRSGETFTRCLNGSEIGTSTSALSLFDNNSALRIGYSGINPFKGKMPVIRMYKGKALTVAELKQNYDATKTRFGL